MEQGRDVSARAFAHISPLLHNILFPTQIDEWRHVEMPYRMTDLIKYDSHLVYHSVFFNSWNITMYETKNPNDKS